MTLYSVQLPRPIIASYTNDQLRQAFSPPHSNFLQLAKLQYPHQLEGCSYKCLHAHIRCRRKWVCASHSPLCPYVQKNIKKQGGVYVSKAGHALPIPAGTLNVWNSNWHGEPQPLLYMHVIYAYMHVYMLANILQNGWALEVGLAGAGSLSPQPVE